MKIQRVSIVMAIVDLAVLMFQITRIATVEANVVPPVLRGHALELVDDYGRLRTAPHRDQGTAGRSGRPGGWLPRKQMGKATLKQCNCAFSVPAATLMSSSQQLRN
jgi:hypothetical protein